MCYSLEFRNAISTLNLRLYFIRRLGRVMASVAGIIFLVVVIIRIVTII
jgi:hypothetical protein